MVPIVISMVVVSMMVSAPAIFIRVPVVAIAVVSIVERSVLLVSRVNVNAEPVVCFGFGRCHGNQPERRQTQE